MSVAEKIDPAVRADHVAWTAYLLRLIEWHRDCSSLAVPRALEAIVMHVESAGVNWIDYAFLRKTLAVPPLTSLPKCPDPVVAEWQARVGPKGDWRRIVPPDGETVEQRVAYLRSYPRYEFRALYAAPLPEAGVRT
jgi:hypothetical protein